MRPPGSATPLLPANTNQSTGGAGLFARAGRAALTNQSEEGIPAPDRSPLRTGIMPKWRSGAPPNELLGSIY